MPQKTATDLCLSTLAFWGFSSRAFARPRLFRPQTRHFLRFADMHPRLAACILELVDEIFASHFTEKMLSFLPNTGKFRLNKRGNYNFPLSPLTL
jgi:hypothetical protein